MPPVHRIRVQETAQSSGRRLLAIRSRRERIVDQEKRVSTHGEYDFRAKDLYTNIIMYYIVFVVTMTLCVHALHSIHIGPAGLRSRGGRTGMGLRRFADQ